MSKLDKTILSLKELHKYSIINNNTHYSDKLLEIIIDLSTLKTSNLGDSHSDKIENEIEKVKRKVPKWMKKTHQSNYKILKAYMDLSDCNEISISVEELEEYVNMGQTFLGHYNSMKTISEKNHAKVFDENNKQVELWEPVAEFVKDVFQCNETTYQKSKYKFNGSIYEKNNRSGFGLGRLLFDIFKEYLNDNPSMSYLEIQKIFNPLHDRFSSEGNIGKVVFNQYDYENWYIKKSKDKGRDTRYFEPVMHNNEKLYFTTQWGDTYGIITNFINQAINDFGYDIKPL